MTWSNDILSIVYTKVKISTENELEEKYPKVTYTTSLKEPKDAEFPCIVFQKLQGTEVGNTNEGNTVNAIESSIQITVIDNVSQNRADKVSDVIMSAMKKLRYQIVGDTVIDNNATTYRNITRYRRTIADDDYL